jgi:ATP-dependent DNA helicase RecG
MANLCHHNVDHFRRVYLSTAIQVDLIERKYPDKPKSKHPQYRLTEKGRRWLRERGAEE